MPGWLPDDDSAKPEGYCNPVDAPLAMALACDADQRGHADFAGTAA
jgi:hypothetical protein